MAFNFAYLDLVCLDCGLFNESLNNDFVISAGKELEYYYDRDFISRIELRIDRVQKFVEYLKTTENQEIIDLSLESTETKFTEKIEQEMEKAFVIIRRSAQKKLDRES